MGILEFLLGVVIVSVIFIIALITLALHYDTVELEKENERLKDDLKKARQRKMKTEYKKVKTNEREEN